MNDLNGWGVVRKMIELYGNDAQEEARRRADKALAQEDDVAFQRWAYIASLVGDQLSRFAAEPTQSE